MFPIILNGIDDDDEDLLSEVNYSGFNNEQSPLFQDNLRCSTVGRRYARRFSFNSASRTSQINQSIQPGERIIEIKSESDDDDDEEGNSLQNIASSSSTAALLNERTNLINDHRFQRYRPIREHDLTTSDQHSQARFKRNYQVLKSKRRLTFPICFFVCLYILFLIMSSFIFTMFEQKMVNTDKFFEIQKKLVNSLNAEQYNMLEDLIEQSVKIQKGGLDSLSILYKNKLIINGLIISKPDNGKSSHFESNKNELERLNKTSNQAKIIEEVLNPSVIYSNQKADILNYEDKNPITIQLKNRKSYNWDFQQALFYVVSIATTIGYGNLTPESDPGKIYTIIFALIAIPYTTILFSIIVSKFSNGPLRRFKLSLLTRHFEEKTYETLRIIRFICLILATLFICIMIMGLPAIAFSKMERNWSYLDGFYFIFISITTTGLGDYVPEFFGTPYYWLYELIVIFFLYFGIILIMLWLTLIKSVFRKSPSIKLEYDQDEEDRHEDVLEEQVLINYHYHKKNYVNYGSFYGYDEITVRLPRSM